MEFPWSQILGRLHPLAVHFPIALLVVAGLVELLRPRRGKPSDAGLVCLVFGSLGAIVAAWSGWEHAEHERVGRALQTLLWQHRWIGVATAVVATITTLLALLQRRSEGGWTGTAYRLGLVLSVLLVSVGGHFGGSLVYGEGYLLELLRDPNAGRTERDESRQPQARAGDPGVDEFGTAIELSPEGATDAPGEGATALIPEEPAVAVAAEESTPAEVAPQEDPEPATEDPAPATESSEPAPVDYLTQIVPIFERSCYECHGATGRAKAGLRLTEMAELFAGDPEYALILPGDAEGSLLFELVNLPAEDFDLMPPEGGPLPPEEIELLRRWINEGASYPGKDDATPAPPKKAPQDPGPAPVEPVEQPEDPAPADPQTPVELSEAQRAARDAALGRLSERGAYAKRLSQTSEAVEVSFGLLGDAVTDADLEALGDLGPCLVSLDLSRTAVTDAGVAGLAAFPRLRRLRLDHTGVGDAALAGLAGLEELSYLNLVKTRVGDAGLAHLETSRGLRRLYLWDSAVTDLGQASLEAALPELKISRGLTALPEVDEEPTELVAGCCVAAQERGEVCDHDCCVVAADRGEVCPSCGKPAPADEG